MSRITFKIENYEVASEICNLIRNPAASIHAHVLEEHNAYRVHIVADDSQALDKLHILFDLAYEGRVALNKIEVTYSGAK